MGVSLCSGQPGFSVGLSQSRGIRLDPPFLTSSPHHLPKSPSSPLLPMALASSVPHPGGLPQAAEVPAQVAAGEGAW